MELTPTTVGAIRRRLAELAESQHWVHHVADLGSGEVRTTALDRPVTPLSRAARLGGLGHAVDSSIFGGPRYTLTPRRPYQASPEAYLVAWDPEVYLPFDDTIVWELPRDYQRAPLYGMDFYLTDTPRVLATASVVMSGKAWPGLTGQVLVTALRGPVSIQIPIGDGYATHTLDLVVPSGGPLDLEIDLVIGAGVETLTFHSMSFGPSWPVLTTEA